MAAHVLYQEMFFNSHQIARNVYDNDFELLSITVSIVFSTSKCNEKYVLM